MTDFQWEPDHPAPERALELLRVLSQPVRAKILRTMVFREPMRVSDIAESVDEAPNSASYHLRQLEKAGIARRVDPAPDRDGRETWWEIPDWNGLSFDMEAVRNLPGGAAVLRAFDEGEAEEILELFSSERLAAVENSGWSLMRADGPLRLTKDEAASVMDRLSEIWEGLVTTSRSHRAGDPDVRDYDYRIAILPRPDAASDSDSPPADEPAPDR